MISLQRRKEIIKQRICKKMIPVNEITNFSKSPPYKVRDDDEMFSMAETVKQFGVIHPVIVRPEKKMVVTK